MNEIVKKYMPQMGIYNTSYLPEKEILYRIAPTEYSEKRKTLLRGWVHDPTCYYFGGVCGHAGIFSIAGDLENYMQIHLRKGIMKNGERVYSEKTV